MSDHISGPRALADPIADITDFYAFPSPERTGRLVLVVNTMPMARPSDLFSAGLLYRFRLRPLTALAADATGWAFVPGDEELVLDCSFGAPEHVSDPGAGQPGHEQHGSCVTPGGEQVTFRVNDEAGGTGDGGRGFAGERGPGAGSAAGSGGTRSSWTPAPPWPRSPPGSSRSPIPDRSSSTARTC